MCNLRLGNSKLFSKGFIEQVSKMSEGNFRFTGIASHFFIHAMDLVFDRAFNDEFMHSHVPENEFEII